MAQTMPRCCSEPGQPDLPLSIKYKTLTMKWRESQVLKLSAVPPDCATTFYRWKVESGPARVSPLTGYETTLTIDAPDIIQIFQTTVVKVQLWCENGFVDQVTIEIPIQYELPGGPVEPEKPEVPPEPEIPPEPEKPPPEVTDWLPRCCYEWNNASELLKIEASKDYIMVPGEVELSSPKIDFACKDTCFSWRAFPLEYPVSIEYGKKTVLKIERGVPERGIDENIQHWVALSCAGQIIASKMIEGWYAVWGIFKSFALLYSGVLYYPESDMCRITALGNPEITFYDCKGNFIGKISKLRQEVRIDNTWAGTRATVEGLLLGKIIKDMEERGWPFGRIVDITNRGADKLGCTRPRDIGTEINFRRAVRRL